MAKPIPPISSTTSTSPLKTEVIVFENNREATAVFPPANAAADDILKALDLKPAKAVLLIIGGADSVDEKVKLRLIQLFGRGIARAAVNLNAVILDGGTEAGVMAMMGQGVADRDFKSSLIGIAPLGMVTYPGSQGAGETPLDPNHSHFVLVDGNAWGAETNVIYRLMSALTSKAPGLVLLAGGGTISKKEVLQAVRHMLPLIVVEGSGGLADEIAEAWKSRPELPEDPVMAEIIADGRIEFHLLSNSVNGAERLILRELGGDNVLLQAWEQFADYDLNAKYQQKRFNRLQIAIIVIGLLGTVLAIAKEVWNHDGVKTALKDWWFYLHTPREVTPHWVGWWLVYYLLLAIPICLTILITAANRFKQGNKWLLLRAGAEAIKREIFRYRTRSGDYREKPKKSPTSNPPDQTGGVTTTSLATTTSAAKIAGATTSPTPPPPTPEQVLAQRVEDITRRVMRTEVNVSALEPYDKGKGFPPDMYAASGGDDGFSLLTPDRYVEVRLGDQLNYYRRKAVKLEQQLKLVQWTIFIIGGLGTLLAAINQQVWIALTTAMAAALTTYLSYQQTENTLMKYNQAATDLSNVRSWWLALPPDEQAKQDNVTTLVDHTEQVLQSELDGWVQQMQNALAELRKGQTPASEKNETAGGTGAGAPQTEAQKAAAEKAADAAAKKTAGDGSEKTDTGDKDSGGAGGGPIE
jgi:hypothetical protein